MTTPTGSGDSPLGWMPAMLQILNGGTDDVRISRMLDHDWITFDGGSTTAWNYGDQAPWNYWRPLDDSHPNWNTLTIYRRRYYEYRATYFEIRRAEFNFYSPAGDMSPAHQSQKLVSISQNQMQNIQYNAALDPSSFDSAAEMLRNVSAYLQQGQLGLGYFMALTGGSGSQFQGTAAEVFLWALHDLQYGLGELKAVMDEPSSWSDLLKDSSQAIVSFKDALTAAWETFIASKHADPNNLMIDIIHSIESQVGAYNPTYLTTADSWDVPWLFDFSSVSQSLGTYDLNSAAGWLALNTASMTLWKGHVDALEQAAIHATTTLNTNLGRLWQALGRPVGPIVHLPPPGQDDTPPGTGAGVPPPTVDSAVVPPGGGGGGVVPPGGGGGVVPPGGDGGGFVPPGGTSEVGTGDFGGSGPGGGGIGPDGGLGGVSTADIPGTGIGSGVGGIGGGGGETGGFGPGGLDTAGLDTGGLDTGGLDSGVGGGAGTSGLGSVGGVVPPLGLGGVGGAGIGDRSSRSGVVSPGVTDEFGAGTGTGIGGLGGGGVDSGGFGDGLVRPPAVTVGGDPTSLGQGVGSIVGPLGSPPSGYTPLGGFADVVGDNAQMAQALAGGVPVVGAGGAAALGAGGSPGYPFMPPMGGMGGGGGGREQEKERERTTWLAEEESVWGTEPDCSPAVVGADEGGESWEGERPVPRPAPRPRPGTQEPARPPATRGRS